MLQQSEYSGFSPHLPGEIRLPESRLQLSTSKWDLAREAVSQLYGQHRELGAADHCPGPTRIHIARLGNLTISMLRYGRDMIIEPVESSPALMVMTVLQGKLKVTARGMTHGGGRGTTTLSAVSDNPRYFYDSETEVMKLHLDQRRLESQCWRMLGQRGRLPLRFSAPMENDQILKRWMALLNYIIGSLDTPLGKLGSELLSANVEEMLMMTLLTGQHHNYSEQLSYMIEPIAPRQWHRAVAFMEAHLCGSVTLVEIAEAAGCSVRSLTRAFREFKDTTPMRHLLELRLQNVRAELTTPSALPRSITVIALHWGFRHLGEFNRHYRERFGETPSQTRANAETTLER
jgi:AraC-like DNA-binding protein